MQQCTAHEVKGMAWFHGLCAVNELLQLQVSIM